MKTEPSIVTTLRVREPDRANADAIIKAGLASDFTGAIRVALALVAQRIVKR